VIGLDQATRERQAEVSTPRAARISAWKGLGRVTTRPDFGASFASPQVDAGAANTFSPYA